MTGYLTSNGVADVTLSCFRGLGAVAGLAATALYPRLSKRVAPNKLGLASVLYQLGWLLIGVVPVLILAHAGKAPSRTALVVLMLSLAASRTGLWMFDLVVSTMLQNRVPKPELGVVNGSQGSVCASFEMASFAVGLAFPRIADFPWLMGASLGAVGTAAAVFAVFAATDVVPPVLSPTSADNSDAGGVPLVQRARAEAETVPLLTDVRADE